MPLVLEILKKPIQLEVNVMVEYAQSMILFCQK